MTNTEKRRRAELEESYRVWAALTEEEKKNHPEKLGRVFELVYRLFPGRDDAINTIFLGEWKRFDPEKGTVYNFFSARIRLREKDAVRANQIRKQHIVEDGPAGKNMESSVLSNLPAGPEADPDSTLQLDATACELLAAILELPQRLQGRANNPERHSYFRMFFTDGISGFLRSGEAPAALLRREADLFRAVNLSFLDYFLVQQCRTVAAVQSSDLKPYGALAEGRPMDCPPAQPLPGDVYASYLKRVEGVQAGASAVSNQRKEYKKFMRDVLC